MRESTLSSGDALGETSQDLERAGTQEIERGGKVNL